MLSTVGPTKIFLRCLQQACFASQIADIANGSIPRRLAFQSATSSGAFLSSFRFFIFFFCYGFFYDLLYVYVVFAMTGDSKLRSFSFVNTIAFVVIQFSSTRLPLRIPVALLPQFQP